MLDAIQVIGVAAILALLLVASPLLAQHTSLEDMLSLDHAETPDHVANQAGTVLGTARVCKVDTTQFKIRVDQLLSHMTEGGSTSDAAKAELVTAAKEAEEKERADPTVGCNDFRRLFTEFWINRPNWTPSDGWKPL